MNLLFEEAKKDTKACHSQMQQRYLAFVTQKKRDYKQWASKQAVAPTMEQYLN